MADIFRKLVSSITASEKDVLSDILKDAPDFDLHDRLRLIYPFREWKFT